MIFGDLGDFFLVILTVCIDEFVIVSSSCDKKNHRKFVFLENIQSDYNFRLLHVAALKRKTL